MVTGRSRCAAAADNPLDKAQLGMRQFLEAGVRADQLVLGAPWSSMYYPCLNTSLPGECDITHQSFSNAPCSDLSGKAIQYDAALAMHLAHPSSAIHRDTATATAVFDVPFAWTDPGRGSGSRARVFWQTPAALEAKYRWAGEAGLRGVGLWTTGYAPQGHNVGVKHTSGLPRVSIRCIFMTRLLVSLCTECDCQKGILGQPELVSGRVASVGSRAEGH